MLAAFVLFILVVEQVFQLLLPEGCRCQGLRSRGAVGHLGRFGSRGFFLLGLIRQHGQDLVETAVLGVEISLATLRWGLYFFDRDSP